ncbi:unnamed protein product [Blepharisma stoltei]|uniref:TOG domain-containing protein n=1 Tax=Blepharisma stoltei TaxID=1481888 RepID=A0AAU9IIT8_9CILI|nr:unnamed protein product [Blepharisma stoltei]
MDAIVEFLASPILNHRKSALNQLLNESTKTNVAFLVPNPTRFFSILKDRLSDDDPLITQQVLQLIDIMIPEFGPDLESNFATLFPGLILLFHDQRPGISKLAFKVICTYATTTRNLETTMSYIIRHGLSHDDWKLKNQTLQYIPLLLRLDLSYTANIPEMKKLFEKIISLLKDSSSIVAETSAEICKELKKIIFDFPNVFSKLSHGVQQVYREKCGEVISNDPAMHRSSISPIKSILERPEKRTSTYAFSNFTISSITNSLTSANSSNFLKESTKNGLIYGFIPPNLIAQLEDTENWRARVNAIHEIENLVSSLQNYSDVYPYIAVFFRFLNNLLEDSNFKVMLSALTIIYYIVSIPGISQHANTSQIIPSCIKKLGDNKIAIRQGAFKVFKALTKEIKPRVLFPQLIDALGSNNWHVRHETLNVIIASILLAKENYDYDFLSIIQPLAKLLDDPKTKIRFVTMEVFAVLAQKYGIDEIDSHLEPIVDNIALDSLHKRYKHKALPIVRDDYIEYPRTVPSSAPLISSPYLRHSEFKQVPASQRIFESDIHSPLIPREIPRISNQSIKRLRSSSEIDERLPNISNTVSFDDSFHAKKNPRKIFNTMPETQIKPVKLNFPERQNLRANFDVSPIKPLRAHKRENSQSEEINSASRSSPLLLKTRGFIIKDFGNSDMSYSAHEDIEPLADPENALKEFSMSTRTDDWSSQFEGLTKLRSIIKYNPELFLSQVTLHNVFLEVIKLAESLRSSLSKNGLIVLGEMCEFLGKNMDNELPELLKILFKKALDTNSFLSEQAQNSIFLMCKFSNENKLSQALLLKLQTAKNPIERATIALCFGYIFEKAKSSLIRMRDIDKIVQALGNLIVDASPDVRDSARRAFTSFELSVPSQVEREKILSRSLSENIQKKLKEPGKARDRAESPFTKRKTQGEFKTNSELEVITPSIPQEIYQIENEISEPDTPIEILRLSEEINQKEWKSRYDAIGKIPDLLEFMTANIYNLTSIVGILSKGLCDQNLKVQIHSLNALIKIIPSLKRILEPHLEIIMQSLIAALGSANSSIREIAKDAVNLIFKNCEHYAIILPLANQISSGNPRAKVAMINFIIEAIPSTHKIRPEILIKYIAPLGLKLMDDPKEDVKVENKKLIKKLYEVIGNEIFEGSEGNFSQRVMEILNEQDP